MTEQGPSLQLLGDFGIRYAGRPLDVPRSAQRLLALLAVQRRPMLRANAAATLWLESRDRQAAANLRAVLYRLRSTPTPLVTTDGVSLALTPRVTVDVWRPPERERVEALATDVLPGWDDDWLVAERERHRQARLHALERICRRHREAGDFDLALEAGLAAVAGEPLRESAHRHVIEVHLAEGNEAEALRQYERYRTQLRRELGLPPTPAIRDLVGRLLGRPIDP